MKRKSPTPPERIHSGIRFSSTKELNLWHLQGWAGGRIGRRHTHFSLIRDPSACIQHRHSGEEPGLPTYLPDSSGSHCSADPAAGSGDGSSTCFLGMAAAHAFWDNCQFCVSYKACRKLDRLKDMFVSVWSHYFGSPRGYLENFYCKILKVLLML